MWMQQQVPAGSRSSRSNFLATFSPLGASTGVGPIHCVSPALSEKRPSWSARMSCCTCDRWRRCLDNTCAWLASHYLKQFSAKPGLKLQGWAHPWTQLHFQKPPVGPTKLCRFHIYIYKYGLNPTSSSGAGCRVQGADTSVGTSLAHSWK